MTYASNEEIEATIAAMDRFESAAQKDPALVDRFFDLLHERPDMARETSDERYERLMKQLAKKRDQNEGHGPSSQ